VLLKTTNYSKLYENDRPNVHATAWAWFIRKVGAWWYLNSGRLKFHAFLFGFFTFGNLGCSKQNK